MVAVPVMRPQLPASERLWPYLKKIDETKIYSNYGPLARDLESRLASHFGLASNSVTTVANGTLGLALALLAQSPRRGALCIMPAWTFVASAHAATMVGLVPYFVDVDPVSGMLDPDRLGEEIANAPALVSAVMPVAPFGQPIDVAAWDRFRSRTGLAVVVDAAASFDSLCPGVTPAVVSLHATKVVGVGEGGFVASADASLIREIRTRANFGFHGTRLAAASAINAKLSEYHAAVGLAALDEWPVARAEWMETALEFRSVLLESGRVRFQNGFGQGWIASTCNLNVAGVSSISIENALTAGGIDSRRWWGDGAHAHPATRDLPRTRVPVTEALAREVIGVPFYRGLPADSIRLIADIVRSALPKSA
jgi:dTDP-4-amino-4,6-dideoxygalactose transaminase